MEKGETMKAMCRNIECDDNESFEVRVPSNGRVVLVCDRCGVRYELVPKVGQRGVHILKREERDGDKI